jgi:subtilisin family serine protease
MPRIRFIASCAAATAALQLIAVAIPGTAGAEDKRSTVVLSQVIMWTENDADAVQVAHDNDVVILETLVGSSGIHLVGSTTEDKQSDLAKTLQKDERVRFAEPNYEGESADHDRFHAWWSDHGSDGDGANSVSGSFVAAGQTIDLTGAHAEATGAGVTVAVIDSGVDADHEQLRGRVTAGWDFVDDDDEPDDVAVNADTDGDGHVDEAWGHGTHVAGIVAQVAPDAEIWSYRVLNSNGSGTAYGVAAALFHATDRGVDVINLSFGLDQKYRSKVLKEALKYAKTQGVIVVAAAGNDGGKAKRYPAADKDVLAVGAADGDGAGLAAFANHGDWVEVAAPGIAVHSTLPNGGYGSWSGSSMAAPFVAGQAALLLDAAPDEKPKKIVEAIEKSSRKADHGNKFKHGVVDVEASLSEFD